MKKNELKKQIEAAIHACLEKKAEELSILEMEKRSGAFTDYFVLCSGTNPRQVQAIADEVELRLKATGLRPTHVEGYNQAEWILVDYVDFVVHVFSEKALGISTNRTAADGAVGYFVTPRFSARVIAAYQKTHGGLTSAEVFSGKLSPDLQMGHDNLLRSNYLRAGFAGSFAVSPSVDLYAGYVKNLWGTDTHYGYGISVGVSHTFPAAR